MSYKLDRTSFSMSSNEFSEPAIKYWRTKSIEERLCASFYLNSVAFNFDLDNPPRLDRDVFFRWGKQMIVVTQEKTEAAAKEKDAKKAK